MDECNNRSRLCEVMLPQSITSMPISMVLFLHELFEWKEFIFDKENGNVKYDDNGEIFEDAKGTALGSTHVAKGLIHMYCVNKEEEDSIDAIAGYFKAFGVDEIKVNYRIVIVTHKDIDCPDITKKLKEIIGKDYIVKNK